MGSTGAATPEGGSWLLADHDETPRDFGFVFFHAGQNPPVMYLDHLGLDVTVTESDCRPIIHS